MATRFKEGTGMKRKAFFHAYAFGVNSTQIGLWAAAGITTSVASDLSIPRVVREGATLVAFYLVPAAPIYTIVKNVDKHVATGKQVVVYGSLAYKAAKTYTSPIEFINYFGAKALTRFGITETIKNVCGVEESDSFYWERKEFSHLNN